MVRVTLPRPFQAYLTIHGLAIATDNLPTKFEVCVSTHYEDNYEKQYEMSKIGWFAGS